MIYLLESSNYYKIGFTKDQDTLKKRLQSYKTHNPEFTLVELFEGDREEEKRLHNLCEKFRHSGEWFIKCIQVLDTINSLNIYTKESELDTLIFNIIGNKNYLEITQEDIPTHEIYSRYRIITKQYIITFYILNSKELLIEIRDTINLNTKILHFFDQELKTYFCNYCEKSDYRKFSGILFESNYILLNVKESMQVPPISDELIYPSIKEIYSCFTRDDFKVIKY